MKNYGEKINMCSKRKLDWRANVERVKIIPVFKVKCTLVQALKLCTVRTVHRGSRSIALPFYDHGTRKE
jgi:hypothetical protein